MPSAPQCLAIVSKSTVAPRGRYDHGTDPLARPRIGQPEHRDVHDVGVPEENVLELERRDVLAVPDDHVLEATGDNDVPLGVELTQVPRAEPTLVVERIGIEGRVHVAQEALWALQPQFPVDDPDLDVW